jgi:hypothetical protein
MADIACQEFLDTEGTRMAWATTYTGKQVYYFDPQPEQIDLVDIIISLSRNHRFGGFSPIKIAQHILEVASGMAREVAENGGSLQEQATAFLVGLLHDFPEYILLDVPTPMKRVLGSAYTNLEATLLRAILRKWNIELDYWRLEELMKKHDSIAVQSEAIRFKLDGHVFDYDTEEHVPTGVWRWVDPNAPQPYSDTVYDEDTVQDFLGYRFVQCMVLTGRAALLPEWLLRQMAEEAPTPEQAMATITWQLPSLFADETQVLVSA